MKDIKSLLELVAAIQLLGVEGVKIAKDGISLADLPEALELLKHIDLIVAAVKDVGDIGAEIKDLDQTELLQLGTALYEGFKAIKAA